MEEKKTAIVDDTVCLPNLKAKEQVASVIRKKSLKSQKWFSH